LIKARIEVCERPNGIPDDRRLLRRNVTYQRNPKAGAFLPTLIVLLDL
jgi:hypothetical protein